jgi:predicted transcriptional regulator
MTVPALRDCTAKILAAYVSNHVVDPDDIPAVSLMIAGALSACTAPADKAADIAKPSRVRVPAVSVERSVGPDQVICLCCGKVGRMLKEHIHSAHGMTPGEYRRWWGLPYDHPLTAPSVTRRMSAARRAYDRNPPQVDGHVGA